MALDVNAQVLVITKEVMAQCFFNEPASAFERCCKDKAEVRDDVIKTITDAISEPIISNLPLYKGKIKINQKINKYNKKPVRQIYCNAGQYLPANAISCTDCRSRYYLCVGGMYTPSTHDQGMTKCPYGQVADYNTKTCVNDNNNNNLNDNKQVIVKPNNNLNDSKPVMVNPVKTILEEKRETARKACEYECNGHAWCKFDEEKMICNHAIDLRGTAEEKALYEEFITDSGGVEWDKETNKFVCKRNTEYSKLKDQDWHWNRDIGACSYTYNGEEYLSAITADNMYYVLSTKMKYPWQHNKIWDHSKDESFCKSIHSSCKYEYVYKGIPKCTCETSDKQFHWVYGQRKCEYCEKVSGKMKCTNMFSSENTHWLEECLDSLAGDRDVVVKF